MFLKIDDIVSDPEQPRKFFDENSLKELEDSISVHGVLQPIAVRPVGSEKYMIVAGERRWRASRNLGLKEIPVLILEGLSDTQISEASLIENVQRQDLNPVEEALAYRRLVSVHGSVQAVAKKVGKSRPSISNSIRILNLPEELLLELEKGGLTAGHAAALLSVSDTNLQLRVGLAAAASGWSVRKTIQECLRQVSEDACDPKEGRGLTLAPTDGRSGQDGILFKRFGLPPFSVLDSKSKEWQERKRRWIGLGLRSEIGRSAKTYKLGMNADVSNNWEPEDDLGSGTSIFDPVLCESIYRWYTAPGWKILDPFAGGPVRCVIAAHMNRYYWGCDLSKIQIDYNKLQIKDLLEDEKCELIELVHGDSDAELASAQECDFVFSCPPYGDLEVYSDKPEDLSAMAFSEFKKAYFSIIKKSCDKLKNNRFSCFVVGDYRCENGFFRDFVSLTIEAFRLSGLGLYNHAILANSCGTAALRATKQFQNGRKLVTVHQHVLVFCKGDWRQATIDLDSSLKLDGKLIASE